MIQAPRGGVADNPLNGIYHSYKHYISLYQYSMNILHVYMITFTCILKLTGFIYLYILRSSAPVLIWLGTRPWWSILNGTHDFVKQTILCQNPFPLERSQAFLYHVKTTLDLQHITTHTTIFETLKNSRAKHTQISDAKRAGRASG